MFMPSNLLVDMVLPYLVNSDLRQLLQVHSIYKSTTEPVLKARPDMSEDVVTRRPPPATETFTTTEAILDYASKSGDCTVLTFVDRFFDVSKTTISKAFITCCREGHVGVASWLYEQYRRIVRAKIRSAAVEACRTGQLEILQWIIITVLDSRPQHGNQEHLSLACEAFYHSYVNTHLHVALWLRNYYGFRFEVEVGYEVLRDLCMNGHYRLVRGWLLFKCTMLDNEYARPRSYVLDDLRKVIDNACKTGNLPLLALIHRRVKLTSADIDQWLGRNHIYVACANRHLHIIRWFHSIFGTSPYTALLLFKYGQRVRNCLLAIHQDLS